MGVSLATIDTHVRRIGRKLGAGNKADLTRRAMELDQPTLHPRRAPPRYLAVRGAQGEAVVGHRAMGPAVHKLVPAWFRSIPSQAAGHGETVDPRGTQPVANDLDPIELPVVGPG
jgi:hypothetical protein